MDAYPFADTCFFTHASLPVAAAYCRTLDVMGVVNRIVPSSMELSFGLAVVAMVVPEKALARGCSRRDSGRRTAHLETDGAPDQVYLAHEGKRLPGWDNKPTDRPTSFIMSTVFYNIQVARPKRGEPMLLRPMSDPPDVVSRRPGPR